WRSQRSRLVQGPKGQGRGIPRGPRARGHREDDTDHRRGARPLVRVPDLDLNADAASAAEVPAPVDPAEPAVPGASPEKKGKKARSLWAKVLLTLLGVALLAGFLWGPGPAE